MFNITLKVAEKDVGVVVRLLEQNIIVHDLKIRYLQRGESKSESVTHKTQIKRYAKKSDHLVKSDLIILELFEKYPDQIFQRGDIGKFLVTKNYSDSSASSILSRLVKLNKITKISYGNYSCNPPKTIKSTPTVKPETQEGNDIVEVIDNVTDEFIRDDTEISKQAFEIG